MQIGEHGIRRIMTKKLFKPTKTVNRYTRAGVNGKVITCPKCRKSFPVFHFSWSALTCIHCKESTEKNEWIIAE